ncbi:glycosyltransferase family protein [Azospirillum sp.]|uniref:glycosyltransferase family protein n=1 Tax=Azospirillum sp. TaxID=34012 RepID=UPI002D52B07E|nr:glycosyltransferase family protein [Azospirillum sp.]HYD70512.1 glycosyltransferase family protein [Azospirillum sp.]
MNRRVLCVSQARMASTRLPGKVLMDAAGRPLLAHHLDRLRRCRRIDAVVLATSDGTIDDPVAALADSLGVTVFRGSEHDVLDRFAGAAALDRAEIVVRVTADCPLIDPALVDAVVGFFLAQAVDYAHLDVSLFPRGLDTEVFTRAALIEAESHATDPAEREHVTPYLYRRPDRFRLASFREGAPARHGGERWCVDEPADLELVRRLLAVLPPGFGWQDVCKVLDDHPEWTAINRAVAQKDVGH